MGLNGLEPSTSRLSGVRSNQLSYRPKNVLNDESRPLKTKQSFDFANVQGFPYYSLERR